jgi:hypothetical protein
MKTKNKLTTVMAVIAAIVALSLMATACKDGDEEEPTVRSSGTTIPLTFTDAPNVTPPPTYSVTITSLDKFTDTEWNTLCDKVVAKIEDEYVRGNNFGNKLTFEGVFAATKNTAIVLSNSAAYKCEVKANDQTIYLKTSAIDTVDFQAAATALDIVGGTNQQN